MPKILIAGGSGLIGRHLCRRLLEHGYEVRILSRTRRNHGQVPFIYWNPEKNDVPGEVINSSNYIINLSGANIGAKRWTRRRREEILQSRINPAGSIFKTLEPESDVFAYITASAIGYYGSFTSDNILEETDPHANDFLGLTCKKWEDAAERFTEKGVRTVKLRTGIVLARNGGVMARLQLPIRLGLASALGTGKQYMPWIHIDDLCDIYIQAIKNKEMSGPYNAVAPEHVTNKEFTRKAAHVLHKPFWFPRVPAFLLKLIFGRMSVILLEGSRISSTKIQSSGYTFKHPELEGALGALYSK
jgi:uncharacterized protein (TIGR01777 family)